MTVNCTTPAVRPSHKFIKAGDCWVCVPAYPNMHEYACVFYIECTYVCTELFFLQLLWSRPTATSFSREASVENNLEGLSRHSHFATPHMSRRRWCDHLHSLFKLKKPNPIENDTYAIIWLLSFGSACEKKGRKATNPYRAYFPSKSHHFTFIYHHFEELPQTECIEHTAYIPDGAKSWCFVDRRIGILMLQVVRILPVLMLASVDYSRLSPPLLRSSIQRQRAPPPSEHE